MNRSLANAEKPKRQLPVPVTTTKVSLAVLGGFLIALAPLAVCEAQSPAADALNPAPSDSPFTFAVQNDGKILVGGRFTSLGGQTRNYLGRLNEDGTLDATFNPGTRGSTPYVYAFALQPDGKIVVGGFFTELGGQPRNRIARLCADGALDPNFDPGATGACGGVYSLVMQPDGMILTAGCFAVLAGQACNNMGRLHPEGTLDASFHPDANGTVYALAMQPDGKILVGGTFTILDGQPRSHLGRLNSDGTLDASFDPGADGDVHALIVQADGSILAGGSFGKLGGQTRSRIGRLDQVGTLDSTFDPAATGNAINSSVHTVALQADGRIILGGFFTNLTGQARSYVGRLNSDGSLDASFNPEPNSAVTAVALQADGKLLLGGGFTQVGGRARTRIGRLYSTDAATQDLSWSSSTVTWTRGGSIPEVWRTVFDASTNGSDWFAVGEGTRLPGGWQFTGTALPAGCTLRARGDVVGADFAATSSWFVETSVGPPAISVQPTSRTNNAGSMAVFNVRAAGTPLLGFRWYKNSVPLTDGGRLSGTAIASLAVSNVLHADIGGYSVVVTNAYGSISSQVASLAVADPAIVGQPVGLCLIAGRAASFTVVATGSPTLAYQWQLNGTNLTGATKATLTVSNVQVANTGNYCVRVTNLYGAAVSSAALLALTQLAAWGAQTNVPPGLTNVEAIASGGGANLALKDDGAVVAWDSTGYQEVPAGLTGVVAVAVGGYHSLALRADGGVVAWGDNTYGQTDVPAGLSGVVAIAAGLYHNLALTVDGTVTAWGLNNYGQTDIPPGLGKVVAVACGYEHSLALRPDGTVLAWGKNADGLTTVPESLTNAVAIGCGYRHSVALNANGKVVAWGSNFAGQTNVPTGLSNVIAIAAGGNHNLALQANGAAAVWGYNYSGQTNMPSGLTNLVAVAAGSAHSLTMVGTGKPFLTTPLLSRSAPVGGTVRWYASATGAGPLKYQWLGNGAPLPNATNTMLSLTNLQTAQAGSYAVIVSNQFGVITSPPATLVVVTPDYATAVDATNLLWSSRGSTWWFVQDKVTHDGASAAQSGAIADRQESVLETTVSGPGLLRFWWKVSSEVHDTVRFLSGGLERSAISGEVDWQQVACDVPAGTQVLQWIYAKDGSSLGGQDAAWLDQVTFMPGALTILQGNPLVLTWPTSATGFFLESLTNFPPADTWVRFSNTPMVLGTNFVLTNTGPAPQRFFRLRSGD
jgi:trimeric autotransporter adhesin